MCDWSVQCTGWHVKEAWRWESVQCSDSAANSAAVRSKILQLNFGLCRIINCVHTRPDWEGRFAAAGGSARDDRRHHNHWLRYLLLGHPPLQC